MSQPVTLRVPYVLPLAVGKEIEWRTFWGTTGFLVKDDVVLEPPLIRDLETGVVYGEHWMFIDLNMYVSGRVEDIPLTIKADLKEHSRFTGKILACHVVWIGSGDSRYPQTTLVIDPKVEAAGYR